MSLLGGPAADRENILAFLESVAADQRWVLATNGAGDLTVHIDATKWKAPLALCKQLESPAGTLIFDQFPGINGSNTLAMSGRVRLMIPNGQYRIALLPRLSTGVRAVLTFLAILGNSTTARAFDKASCVASHASAQRSMKMGRRRESKEQLLVCADASCPSLVRDDCDKWLSKLEVPPSGNGSLAAAETPGVPVPSAPPVEAHGGPDEPSPGDDLVRSSTAPPRRSHPIAAWVTGALALTSFATAAVLGVRGVLNARLLRDTCAPNCQGSRVSAVRQDLLIADLSALTGVAFSAVTAWMVWTHRDADADEGRRADATRLSAWITGRSFRLDYARSF